MKIVECKAKVGKKKQNIVIFLVSDADIEQLDENCLHGTFERGQLLLAHEDKEEEMMEMLKNME
jgi:hypothetical protein